MQPQASNKVFGWVVSVALCVLLAGTSYLGAMSKSAASAPAGKTLYLECKQTTSTKRAADITKACAAVRAELGRTGPKVTLGSGADAAADNGFHVVLTVTRSAPDFIVGALGWRDCSSGTCAKLHARSQIEVSALDSTLKPRNYANFARFLVNSLDLPI